MAFVLLVHDSLVACFLFHIVSDDGARIHGMPSCFLPARGRLSRHQGRKPSDSCETRWRSTSNAAATPFGVGSWKGYENIPAFCVTYNAG